MDEPLTETPDEADGQPAAPATDPRPTWTYFLSPAALVIGALIISATIWFRYEPNSDEPGNTAARSESLASQQAPVSTATDLVTAFKGYAAQIGINEDQFGQCLKDDQAAQAKVALINKQLQRGAALGVTGTPTFVINNKMIVGAQPWAIFEEVIDKELKGGARGVQEYSANIQALAATTPPRFQILGSAPDVSDAVVEGSPQAKVVVAEFSDFQCPFCKRWSDENLTRIRARLGKDVALAFLHFPITQIHPNAGNASLAAICAGEQGKFWPMHDLLFARQTEWADLRTN